MKTNIEKLNFTDAKKILDRGGLTHSEAEQLIQQYGKNELRSEKPKLVIAYLIDLLKEPMVYFLVICGVIYFILGDHNEAIMLLAFLFLIVGITIFQEKKTDNALAALKSISSPRAMVFREGQQKRIAGVDLVPGDIVYLNEGDYVPADSILLNSVNIEINESILTGESIPVAKKENDEIFSGTTVVQGHGVAAVHSTGQNTSIGKIGTIIQKKDKNSSRLETEANNLVKRVTVIAVSLSVIVIIVFSLHNHNWIKGALIGISLAMAILPNELPAVLTIYFAMAAWKLSKRHVLTRKISAIENLGSITVLCVDKTGTLTMNQMAIEAIYSKGKKIDLTGHLNEPLEENFHEILEYGILAGRKDPQDPMEIAFIKAGNLFLKGTEHLHHDWNLEKEYPLTPALLSVTHAWRAAGKNGFVIGVKGSPEAVFDLCHMNDYDKKVAEQVADQMAAAGMRILGVAKAESSGEILPLIQHDFNFSFLGLIGIADPIRPGIKDSILECKNAGIRVLMLTGDHPKTAISIAHKIGLVSPDKILTGVQIENMTDDELSVHIKTTSVFSRIMPEQKLRLVQALMKAGEIVAMTGDGVNDAPALRSAHVGIAMGERGTDVARESSDIVLLNDDFSSIIESIRCGRKVYINIKNAFIYLFSIHIPIAGMSILPALTGLPLVLLPAHIALLHLIIEPASSIAYDAEEPVSNLMSMKPRSTSERLFDFDIWYSSLIRGGVLLAALVIVYLISLWRKQGEEDARTLVFTTLILSNTLLIFLSRSTSIPIQDKFLKMPSNFIIWLTLLSLFLLACALYIPSMRVILNFSFMHTEDILICITATIFSVGLSELSIAIAGNKIIKS